MNGVMTTVTKQTNRIANWLSRATSTNELNSLSDRALKDIGWALKDIGLARHQSSVEASKPFWMA